MTQTYPLVLRVQRVGSNSRNRYDEKIIEKAARHNLREIKAELLENAANAIDPRKSHLNFVLRGEGTAAAVVQHMEQLIHAANAKILRKDNIRGVELVFSLPTDSTIDVRACFEDFLNWVESHYQGIPVISAVAHLDESAPHVHVILLPIKDGHFRGSEIMGNANTLKALHRNCVEVVGKKYNLVNEAPKTGSDKKRDLEFANELIEYIRAEPSVLTEIRLRRLLSEILAKNTDKLRSVLANQLRKRAKRYKATSFVGVMTKKVKSLKSDFVAA